ncbi:hypothetical protein ACE6H2_022933 [Prunus campanulata]
MGVSKPLLGCTVSLIDLDLLNHICMSWRIRKKSHLISSTYEFNFSYVAILNIITPYVYLIYKGS